MSDEQTNWIMASAYLEAVGNLYNHVAAIVGLTHTMAPLPITECVNWHGAAHAIDHLRTGLRDDLARVANSDDLYGVAHLLMFTGDLARRKANENQ